MRPGEDTVPVSLIATRFADRYPALSPDGRWLAYSTDETGRREVYVVPFPNAASARWAVSTDGGTEPVWARRGEELFYRNGLGDMVVVPVETEPTFSSGTPSVLFSATGYLSNVSRREYDVSLDGERFIMIRQTSEGNASSRLIWVQNFFEELKARVPN